jgi:hypothetical protein
MTSSSLLLLGINIVEDDAALKCVGLKCIEMLRTGYKEFGLSRSIE